MAQYITGAVNTTSGSAIVTGVADDDGNLPLWLSYLEPGDEIIIANDLIPYTIATVDSDTQLTLTGNYPTARVAADYVAFTDFTPMYNLPKINRGDIEWPVMFNRAMQIIDQSLGASSGPIADLEVTNTFTLNRPGSGNAALNLEWTQPTAETTVTIPETNLDASFVLTRTDAGVQNIEDDIVFEGDVEVQGELTANIVDPVIKQRVISLDSVIHYPDESESGCAYMCSNASEIHFNASMAAGVYFDLIIDASVGVYGVNPFFDPLSNCAGTEFRSYVNNNYCRIWSLGDGTYLVQYSNTSFYVV